MKTSLNKIKGRHIHKSENGNYATPEEYIWHIPKQIRPLNIQVGDIVKVQAGSDVNHPNYGNTWVQVTEIYREEWRDNPVKYKFVTGIVYRFEEKGWIELENNQFYKQSLLEIMHKYTNNTVSGYSCGGILDIGDKELSTKFSAISQEIGVFEFTVTAKLYDKKYAVAVIGDPECMELALQFATDLENELNKKIKNIEGIIMTEEKKFLEKLSKEITITDIKNPTYVAVELITNYDLFYQDKKMDLNDYYKLVKEKDDGQLLFNMILDVIYIEKHLANSYNTFNSIVNAICHELDNIISDLAVELFDEDEHFVYCNKISEHSTKLIYDIMSAFDEKTVLPLIQQKLEQIK